MDLGILRRHEYEFEIIHRVTSPADESAKGGLHLKGKAIISGGTQCTYSLKVKFERLIAMPFIVDTTWLVKIIHTT